jgi:hypothetical protein
METNNNDIDKLFRDNLDGHSSPFVSGAWERMETMLNDGNKGLLRENIHRYVLASVVSTIILAGSVVAYVSGYDSTTGTFAENGNATEQSVIVDNATTTNTTNTEVAENSVAQNKIAETAATNTKAQTGRTTTTKNNSVTTKSEIIPATTDATKEVVKNTATTANNEAENQTATTETVVEEAQPAITETESVYEKRTYLQDALGAKTLHLSIAAFDNSILDAETQKGKETFTNTELERKQKADRRNLTKLNYGFILGGNFNSVLSNTGANGWGKGLLAGIYLSKNCTQNPRWGTSIGLNYLQSNGNSIGRTITQTTYFFERTTTSYYLLTKSFDYLQAPINVSYTAGLNHKFSMGVVASYLVNSQTEVAQQKEKTGEFISTTKTEKGVYEDMNRFGFGLMAGYEYKLPGIYSIGLRYNQQFNSVTNSSYFTDTKKLPASIQVYLRLNLTR